MEWIISKIVGNFGENYSFLKLLKIVYNRQKKSCLITFLYPEDKDLSEAEKNEISNFVVSTLNISANVTVKFKKSYLDNDLVLKALFTFLDSNYPSIKGFLDRNSAILEKNFKQISITLNADSEFLNYINEVELKESCREYLEKNFCSEFLINFEKIKFSKNITLQPKEKLKSSTPRFDVEIVKQIFGGEIIPKPEFIKNIKSEKKSVILAGKIEGFEKKSKKKKKGKQKGTTKYYYSFVLNDSTAKLETRYFSTKTNLIKMDSLKDGLEVLILGDVEEFNQRLTFYVKSISLCLLPEKIELKRAVSKDMEVVSVTPYSILTQENLFKKEAVYSPEILEKSYVVFDVETTGLNYEEDELLEIGAVKIENGKIVSKFASLIKPKNPIPASATLINNITDKMVENSPSVEPVIRDFYRYTRNCILVGYNVSFDQKFVMQAAKKEGLLFDNEFLDLMPIAKSKLRLTRYKLIDVVKRLEITLDGAHRAYADALATAEAFLKLNSKEFL